MVLVIYLVIYWPPVLPWCCHVKSGMRKMSCRLGEQLSQTKHVWMCACLCVVMLVLHVHMHWAWEAHMISPLSCCADPSHWWKVVDRAEVSGVWVFVYSGEETEGRCIIFSASSHKGKESGELKSSYLRLFSLCSLMSHEIHLLGFALGWFGFHVLFLDM